MGRSLHTVLSSVGGVSGAESNCEVVTKLDELALVVRHL